VGRTDDILDAVRDRSGWVAERAAHARIDDERLSKYTVDTSAGTNATDEARPVGDDENVTALVVQLDAINFGSGWHPVLRKPSGRSGSATIATAYGERAERHGVLSANELTSLTAEQCAQMLGQDPIGEAGDLMALFAGALNELGRFVVSRFGGCFTGLVAEAGGSAARLVDLLREMPMYRDQVTYQGRQVPFLKRAQITVHDLATAFDGRGPGAFFDVDRLTMFADNLVPHVLRVDGVLRLDPALEARISRCELLAYGSPEEVELRAGAVVAVERLSQRTGVAPRHLDTALWHRGGLPRYKAIPRPRCRTFAY
jgi:Potential Queuosine, Q, salvage protein family